MPSRAFPVSERIAYDWHLPKAVNANRGQLENCCSDIDPDSIGPGTSTASRRTRVRFTAIPSWPRPSAFWKRKGRDGFYKGPVAPALVAKVQALGGTMTMEDLANYKGEWAEPVTSDYHGYTLAELPPPSPRLCRQRDAEHPGRLHRQGLSGPDPGLAGAQGTRVIGIC